MLKYILQRMAALIVTLFIIVSASFFILRLMPGSFVSDPLMEEDVRKALEDKYHLNEPMVVQYGYFLKDFVKLDFGVSLAIQPKVEVNEILANKIPISMQLNIFSLILTIPIGLTIGIIAALKKNTAVDHTLSVLIMVCISVPAFIFASVMQYCIAFKLGWLPIVVTTERTLTWSKFVSLILPILSLSFGAIAGLARFMRAELSEALNSDYMLLAKSKGLSQLQATLKHAIRNSFLPLSGMIINMFVGILFGALVTEKIFSVPGMGGVMMDAINAKDHTVTIGVLFWYSLIGLLSILIIDLSYGIIDPRIRMGGKK